MEATGSQEILMTALASQEKWETTLRWDSVDVLFKLRAAENREYALNPTHEEVVTTLMKNWIQSYKDLDCMSVYQFQTKFRNEKRAKSGILRWREFLMKDMYSFHRDQASLDAYFEKAKLAYERVFERLGIAWDTYYTLSDGAPYAKYGYEFQTELAIGEDRSYICDACGLGHNSEIVNEQQFLCSSCGSDRVTVRQVSEVGNIFKLGTKFSDDFGVTYTDHDGQEKSVYMGCYGIGVSRLMGVLAEKFSDEKGLVWWESIAPYSHVILVVGDHLHDAELLAKKLEWEGHSVMIDDRDMSFGMKAADADLFGIPHRIVISDKSIAAWGYEYKMRTSQNTKIHSF